MDTSNINNEIKRLNLEDFLWALFAILSIINIQGDKLQKEYLYSNKKEIEKQSNDIFTLTLTVTLFIYLYFFIRNYNAYKKASKENKRLFEIKILGSAFLIAGIISLIYFQTHNPDFVGSPSL